VKRTPQRLAALEEELKNLRWWAGVEAGLGNSTEATVWRQIGDWADGTALKYRLNIDQTLPGAAAPETANTVSRSAIRDDARRDGGEIPTEQVSRELTHRPRLQLETRNPKPGASK